VVVVIRHRPVRPSSDRSLPVPATCIPCRCWGS